MVVDCHVHLRDFNQRDKETVEHGLIVARDTGVDAVFDMPNTDPPIMTRELVVDRLKLAEEAKVPEVFYGLYMGLTGDPEQVKEAIGVYREFFPKVVGFKLYAGHSVGNLGVIDELAQQRIYQTLSEEGFDGVLAVHCEKESRMDSDVFDRDDPISHSYARPEIAEIASIEDQINFALSSGFRGKLHIAHISVPKAVDIVNSARLKGLDISCGVCPHHIIYDNRMMLREEDGLLYKMNPPLRAPGRAERMFDLLASGDINWIETDHAPHTLSQKMDDCASGLPALHKWNLFLRYLEAKGLSKPVILDRTHEAVAGRFGIDINRRNSYRKDHSKDYIDIWRSAEILVDSVGKS